MTFLKLTPDLELEIIESEDKETTLECLQKGVGGLIERASAYFDLPEDLDAWVDEEGLYKGLLPVLWYRFKSLDGQIEHLPLMGNVMFSGGADEEGHILDLNDEQIDWIREHINFMGKVIYRDERAGRNRISLFKDFTEE